MSVYLLFMGNNPLGYIFARPSYLMISVGEEVTTTEPFKQLAEELMSAMLSDPGCIFAMLGDFVREFLVGEALPVDGGARRRKRLLASGKFFSSQLLTSNTALLSFKT